jgi:probable HAF family extracellular repeat protein
MFKHLCPRGFLFVVSFALLTFFSSADLRAQSPEYTVTLLGSLGASSVAYGINYSGEIVGTSSPEAFPPGDAVAWSGTTPTILGPISSGANAVSTAVNASGVAVGYGSSLDSPSDYYAISWTSTTPTMLGSLGGLRTEALAINASGEIAGYLTDPQGSSVAVEWTGTTPTVLDSENAFGSSEAFGLDDAGEAVGYLTPSAGLPVPVEWTGTTPTILQSVTGGGRSAALISALAINASGEIVGTSGRQAVEWTGTSATVLGAALGGNLAEATAINSLGQVVGYSGTTGGAFAGFIYTGGTSYNINSLLVPGSDENITNLYGINDSGVMVGVATVGSQQYAVQLNPVAVPEPSDMWLSSGAFAIGAGFIVLRGRRRSRPVQG